MYIKEYQITLICATGEYKPISTIIKREQEFDVDLTTDEKAKTKLINDGVIKICCKKYWSKWHLIHSHYTKCKIRLYDKEKIEAENRARYEAIKEAKYASGEWKRPKMKKNSV